MRYFFQWMILITMALSLAACGGSSGSKGDTGATGADGTVATPTQSGTLAFSFAATADAIDNDTRLGLVTQKYTLSGTDNVSGSSSTRYYFYEGTSSSGRDLAANLQTSSAGADGIQVQAEDATSDTVNLDPTSSAIDTRMKPTGHDNYTITLTGYETGTLGASATNPSVLDNGSVSYLTVCPGNPGGDTTASCATVALADRGSRSAVGLDSGNSMLGSNPKAFILPANSASGNAMYLLTDNLTHFAAVSLTESKTADATVSSLASETTNNKGNVPGYLIADNISDAVVGSTTIYTTAVSTTDNGTILIKSITSSGTVATYDTVAGSGDNNSDKFMLSWNTVGSALYGAGTLNGSSPNDDNLTVQTYALDGSSATFSDNFSIDNVTGTGGAWCFAAGSPKWGSSTATAAVVLAARDDNGSWGLMTDAASDGTGMTVGTNQMTGTTTLQDNSTGGINNNDGGLRTGDNHSALARHCDIAWNFSTSSSSQTGQDNGTIVVAFTDNSSAVRVGIVAQDNTTTEIGGVLAGTGTGSITDVEVGIDSGDNKTILAIVKGGSYYLLKQDAAGTAFDTLISATSIGGTDNGSISLNVTPDGSAYAIAVDGANDNASVKIFYDE